MRRPLPAVALTTLCLASCDDAREPQRGGPDIQVPADASPADAAPAPDTAQLRDAGPSSAQALVLGVPETASRRLTGLTGAVHVVRTEADVPHIYASNPLDLARVQGFLTARDRYFMMDLARRLAQGRIAALLGEPGLATDITSRSQGMTEVAARLATQLTTAQRASWEAYADGINAYVAAAQADELPVPSELALAAPLLGFARPADALTPFTVEDIAAFATTVIFQSGFESSDLERELGLARAEEAIAALPAAELRRSALYADIYERVEPIEPVPSIDGWPGLGSRSAPGGTGGTAPSPARPRAPAQSFAGLVKRLGDIDHLFGHVAGQPFGSNAWAIGGGGTPNGGALLAGDGHLALSVPGLFYQSALDTTVFGAGDISVAGLMVPGLPPMGVGTNGDVAWSFTYFYADVVDWYAESVELGPDGRPASTRFGDAWRPLVETQETYSVANVAALNSVGRDQTESRWTLFDGRRLMAVEGRPAEGGAAPGPGESLVNFGDGPWIPSDVDGDGEVRGVSVDYTGLDVGAALDAYESFSKARSVSEFRDLHTRLGVFGSHFNVADRDGHILATGYHAVPCREALPRDASGRWAPGADPARLLDGTRFGGFTIPFRGDGRVDEQRGAVDASACVVPFERFPAVIDPARQFVFTANNDPAGYAFDGNLANDAEYVGASWDLGFRARRIHDQLEALASAQQATPAAMSALQDDHFSPLGARYVPDLVALLDRVESEPELTDRFAAEREAFAEVRTRLQAWAMRGFDAASGVHTFYEAPSSEAREDAVATMLFNAWLGHAIHAVFDDEGLQAVDRVGDRDALMGAFDRAWRGRGPNNPLGLASWVPETQESLYFDDAQTPEFESSDLVVLTSLKNALEFLRAPPESPGQGGFGTADMSAWLWGLRHQVRLESLLIGFLGDQAGLAALFNRFSITPQTLPLAPDLARDDPRRGLVGFPRSGDAYGVDAAHPGLRAQRFEYRNGPVFRLVVELTPERARGTVVLPGGQSGLNDSPHFADQAALWLGNQTLPLRFELDDVVAGATGREVYLP